MTELPTYPLATLWQVPNEAKNGQFSQVLVPPGIARNRAEGRRGLIPIWTSCHGRYEQWEKQLQVDGPGRQRPGPKVCCWSRSFFIIIRRKRSGTEMQEDGIAWFLDSCSTCPITRSSSQCSHVMYCIHQTSLHESNREPTPSALFFKLFKVVPGLCDSL